MQNEISCFLIDNDEDDQEIFQMVLHEINDQISCIVATDGITAIKKLKSDSFIPSFIFIDMNMPLMNGLQCLQEIKKMSQMAAVPVYIYSTAADPHSIEQAKALGASGFLMKPSGFRELVKLLSSIIPGDKSERSHFSKK